jgi:NAD(P)-dependent dehydrogenase (short-subunit alcohol dehydrogenase family)
MKKNILLTGATDGIGLETAISLVSAGHHVLLHGRNPAKLEDVKNRLSQHGTVEGFVADLSNMNDVALLAQAVTKKYTKLDVLINNAGVYRTPTPIAANGLDVRFMVNTIAPYFLTQQLLALFNPSGRVINLSSAAQSSVDLTALSGQIKLPDNLAYAQSKLALIMWSRYLALSLKETGPAIIAVNPGSLLGSKMVKEAYGIDGGDIAIGAKILTRLSLDSDFQNASGKYYDNDSTQFASPHPDALDPVKTKVVIDIMEDMFPRL